MRPLYETEQQRKAEEEAAKEAEKLVPFLKLHRFGITSVCDYFMFYCTRPYGFAEFKIRSHSSTDFPAFFLSLDKATRLMHLSSHLTEETTGKALKCILFVKFTDGIFRFDLLDLDPDKMEVKMAGREKEMRDEHDREPIIHVPMSYFKRLGEKKDERSLYSARPVDAGTEA